MAMNCEGFLRDNNKDSNKNGSICLWILPSIFVGSVIPCRLLLSRACFRFTEQAEYKQNEKVKQVRMFFEKR